MFDNPQQEVKKMSKKLRPIKMSDEEFELFYKEIYEEFGPKGVPAFDPKAYVAEPVEESVEEFVEEPVVPMVDEVPVETPAAPIYPPVEEVDQELTAKAAAVIRDVQEDEAIDDYTDGVKVTKKEKGVVGLVVTLCFECLAIIGVVAYWLVHVL